MNLTLEQNVPVELSAVLKRLLQLSTPQALQFPVSPQSSTDEVKAKKKTNLPLEEVDLRADKTSNPCVRHTIKRSQREKSASRPRRSLY